MQGYLGEDVEALVVGADRGNASIYHIDTRGTVTCADDVGFRGTLGLGMASPVTIDAIRVYGRVLYYPSLATVYNAKKAADISPGVGTKTDLQIVYRDNVERIELGNI